LAESLKCLDVSSSPSDLVAGPRDLGNLIHSLWCPVLLERKTGTFLLPLVGASQLAFSGKVQLLQWYPLQGQPFHSPGMLPAWAGVGGCGAHPVGSERSLVTGVKIQGSCGQLQVMHFPQV
jgi:hypothetical protein